MTAVLAAALAFAPARAAQVELSQRFIASDGVSLQVLVGGQSPLEPRPVIVEFSPYRPGCCPEFGGPGFNYLQVHIRGTGDSDGRFDSLGPRTQADVVEVLDWACHQPWSNGTLGVFGFSASAITFYNSLHLPLPCVKAAVMWSGTYDLYRDLIFPGGVPNSLPGIGVLGLIGAPALAAEPGRLRRDPAATVDVVGGIADAGVDAFLHQSLDRYWQERGVRGDVNHLAILVINGFFDVESRGAFQAFQAFRDDGAHLLVVGAHDGVPVGAEGVREAAGGAWFDHYLKGIDNGIEASPRVQLWMADGDREDDLAGAFVRYDGTDWPIPGTTWESLFLSPAKSGTAHSLNDGSLLSIAPAEETAQSYPMIPTVPSASDQPNTAIVGPNGVNALAEAFPLLTETTLAEPLGLSYTTGPLSSPVLSAGPASLELLLSSTATESDIWAIISDVWPDGSPHPVATGRLRTSYPDIDLSRSLVDPSGAVVQPYGIYSGKTPAEIGAERRYFVEFWPIGNRFKAGHRIRLDIVGVSLASTPAGVAVNTVRVGGPEASRLLFPVLPGSDLGAALSS
ncbi:MAG: CocE/NonD family hydrolase [Actinomycetota bacterium]